MNVEVSAETDGVSITLIDAQSQAERRTFEQVFDAEHQTMVRVAFLLLGSEALAEEAVQDAFARLLDRFDAVENPGGFVRTATVNRCRDLLRRRNLERRILGRFRPRGDEPEQPDHLSDVLAGLDRRKREVIVLRFYLGYSHAEIAEQLNMKEGTVRTTLHRGLAELRGVLA